MNVKKQRMWEAFGGGGRVYGRRSVWEKGLRRKALTDEVDIGGFEDVAIHAVQPLDFLGLHMRYQRFLT